MDSVLDYSFGPGFDALRDELLQTPEEREEYERDVRAMAMVRKLLMAIDVEREHRGITKNELAELVGANPQVIRRLFTSERANPTLKTVLEILAALRIDLEFKLLEVTTQGTQVTEAAPDTEREETRTPSHGKTAKGKAPKREAA